MIVIECEQGTPEWHDARLGIPTASRYGDIVTPKKLELSKSSTTYRNQLLAEWLVGYPIDWSGQGQWMDRGQELEPKARAFYEMLRDVEVRQVGFILRDDRETGCSPDGLVGEDGGLEIKCPAMHTHIDYLLDPEKLVDTYRTQVQGSLYVTGREWWDLMSFNPSLPEVIVRVEPDPAFAAALDAALETFLADLAEAKEKLAPHKIADPILV